MPSELLDLCPDAVGCDERDLRAAVPEDELPSFWVCASYIGTHAAPSVYVAYAPTAHSTRLSR